MTVFLQHHQHNNITSRHDTCAPLDALTPIAMSFLSSHLEQINYSCQGIDSLPYAPPHLLFPPFSSIPAKQPSQLPASQDLHNSPPLQPRHHLPDPRHRSPRTRPLLRPRTPDTILQPHRGNQETLAPQDSLQRRIGRDNHGGPHHARRRVQPPPAHRRRCRPRWGDA